MTPRAATERRHRLSHDDSAGNLPFPLDHHLDRTHPFLENESGRALGPLHLALRSQNMCRPQSRVTRHRYLGHGSEDAHLEVSAFERCGLDERGLREVELARHRLHLLGGELTRLGEDSQRIAGEWTVGEDIDPLKMQLRLAHIGLGCSGLRGPKLPERRRNFKPQNDPIHSPSTEMVANMSRAQQESKQRLRSTLRDDMAMLDSENRRSMAAAIEEQVLALPELGHTTRVFCCLSFGVEPDTRQLVDRLLESGREVYVPRADFATRAITVHHYPCELERLPFGLEQPLASEPAVDPNGLEAALVLGLAFDRQGYRLGHGGGFFDRFLPGRPFSTIGLAYGLQLVDRLPIEAHDQALQTVVTEIETIRP